MVVKALQISSVSKPRKTSFASVREAGNSSGMQGDCLVSRKSLLAAADGPEVLLVSQEDSNPTEDPWEPSQNHRMNDVGKDL